MATSTVLVGAFPTPADADRAKLRLVQAGVSETSIALSTDLAADALAAECPGQSYTNQPGQSPSETFTTSDADTAHVGGCVLRVELAPTENRAVVEMIMRESGARQAPCGA
ncbi:hypothetical protein [Azoarcus sp. KH32C]|uniref:hypothetical protein n=1 Tax=Azoarcus sp. KH32C TaxID=748247 RepID=UPI00034AC50C|nr:hypothetical protein [Azoarcus sp. KH32C]